MIIANVFKVSAEKLLSNSVYSSNISALAWDLLTLLNGWQLVQHLSDGEHSVYRAMRTIKKGYFNYYLTSIQIVCPHEVSD